MGKNLNCEFLVNPVVKELCNKKDKELAEAFLRFLDLFFTPSFGSISKRDVDIHLFMELMNLGIISNEHTEEQDQIYEIVSKLKITRSKARNLLYEAKLRMTTEEKLEEELERLLKNAIAEENGKWILLEVSNPYLIDYIKHELKKMKKISDGSFSPEIVKLSIVAYAELLKKYKIFSNEDIKEIIKKVKEQFKDELTDEEKKKLDFATALNKIIKVGQAVQTTYGIVEIVRSFIGG